MRGKEYLRRADADLIRITPAYAGKSELNAARDGANKDHPRVCGEKMSSIVIS